MTTDPRQRWRLVVARDEAARELVHRDVVTAWEAGLREVGLPIAMSETATPRPRISFAAPAPIGMLAERELIDVVLTERVLLPDMRTAVEAAAPAGYRCVDLYDVWLGRPTLAGLVASADYRATVTTEAGEGPTAGDPEPAEIETAVGALLAAPRIEFARTKGQGEVTVDIRPHIHGLRSAATPIVAGGASASASAVDGALAAGGTFELWMRLRLGGEGGVGRPEEVVAALGRELGRRLVASRLVRERIVLADDPDA
ncbi:MAG TPA: TIGR03936 family radical SAM-associated protein [Candidatus Limnocylindrales bacterium]